MTGVRAREERVGREWAETARGGRVRSEGRERESEWIWRLGGIHNFAADS